MSGGFVSGSRPANRREVLDELSASENRYLKSLKSIINAYLLPLRDSHVLSSGETSALFRTLTHMRDVHAKMAAVFATASEEESVTLGVGIVANEFMLAKAALLELYIPYVRGHESAMRLLSAIQQRPEASRALSHIESTDERVSGRPLSRALTHVCARPDEYAALLGALHDMSSPSDKGYAALGDALDMCSAISKEARLAGYVPETVAHTRTHEATLAGSPMPARTQSGAAPPAQPQGGLLPDLLSRPSQPAGLSTHSAAIVAAAMPAGASPQRAGSVSSSALLRADTGADVDVPASLSPEAVVAAQAEAEDAARRLEALEREVEVKESELRMSLGEVARAEAEKARRPPPDTAPMDEALRSLNEEEKLLLSRLSNSEQRALFEAFLSRKRELEDEEARLNAALAEHEDTLAQVRARLANPPATVLPADPAKASLYITWKRALAEREELLRAARRRKHELLRDLKARHETQVVLLEMERRAAVDSLQESVQAERAKVDAYKRDIAALDESIEGARTAMKRFRQEFEQLRVALLIDRMAKSSQVANLADRRRRLAKEAEQFQEAVEAAKQKVAAEEAAKWEAKLAAEREAGEQRVAEERRLIEQKIEKVRSALAERYEAGFKPLLKEAEARHVEELQRIVDLQRELESKEAELRAAHEAARAVSSAVADITNGADAVGANGEGSQHVPDWKLREFEDLKNAVATMWESLDVPAEDITAFLSECDLLAPYHPKVLEMYQDMYRRLTNAAAAAAAAVAPPSPERNGAAPSGVTAASSSMSSGPTHSSAAPESSYGAPPPPPPQRGSTLSFASPASAPAPQPATSSAAMARRVGAAPASASRTPSTGTAARRTDDDLAVLQRAMGPKPLPPSLGGPGARPTGRGNGPASGGAPGQVRRSPSPEAAYKRRLEI